MYERKQHKRSDLELLKRLPIPRGKIVVAALLVTAMLCMWARLLLSGRRGNAAAVSAAVPARPEAVSKREPAVHLTAIELPVVAGRHDRLARDFFRTSNWRAFQPLNGRPSITPQADSTVTQDITNYDLGVLEQNIKLDGIIAEQKSNTREAFINGKLVCAGGQIEIEYKSRPWTLTVIAIHKDRVVLGLENHTLNVVMPQAESLNN